MAWRGRYICRQKRNKPSHKFRGGRLFTFRTKHTEAGGWMGWRGKYIRRQKRNKLSHKFQRHSTVSLPHRTHQGKVSGSTVDEIARLSFSNRISGSHRLDSPRIRITSTFTKPQVVPHTRIRLALNNSYYAHPASPVSRKSSQPSAAPNPSSQRFSGCWRPPWPELPWSPACS